MTEQYATYWPTYEGLRILQTEDIAALAALVAQPRNGKDIMRLVTMTRLKIAIRERAEKLAAFEKLARDILANNMNALIISRPDEASNDRPF